MDLVRKTAIPLAIVVAILIQLVAFAWYWISEPFITIFWFVPLVIAVTLTILWSLIAVVTYRGPKRILPLTLIVVSLTLYFSVPYADFSTHIDFNSKRNAMTEIALNAQQGALPYDVISSYTLMTGGQFTEYKLPKRQLNLAKQKSIYTSDVVCGKYVFFPTFYGIPDGVGGFLFVPECAEPEHFPGGRFGAKWFGIERLEDRWFRIDGT